MYLYLTVRAKLEWELVQAECWALTRCLPDRSGVALPNLASTPASPPCDITRAAYTKQAVRVLLHEPDLPSLYQMLAMHNITAEQFCVQVIRANGDPPALGVAARMAELINGDPCLSVPQVTFVVVLHASGVWFGEVIGKSSRQWCAHERKLYTYSSSLPTRIARAMVNMGATPGQRIIDPCCGSGTILIEAASMGITAVGNDNNKRMMKTTQANLAHFGYTAEVLHADARQLTGSYDAVITDLPYGKNCLCDLDTLHALVGHFATLAPRVILIAGGELAEVLHRLPYEVTTMVSVPKNGKFMRYLYVLEVRTAGAVPKADLDHRQPILGRYILS